MREPLATAVILALAIGIGSAHAAAPAKDDRVALASEAAPGIAVFPPPSRGGLGTIFFGGDADGRPLFGGPR
jgi:hypothetical protein